ncbi:hypothetical protein [Ancylobacter terrae]|uniref:hypothetical protein n=1 Tax=Ancylobacter sp. sgz301288 TaxID=3342077 RepID=UPI00385B0604
MSAIVLPFREDLPSIAEATWLPLPMVDRDELTMLRGAGVSEYMLRDVKAFACTFFLANFFELAQIPGDGERCFIVPIRDAREEVIDLAAWPITNPRHLARWSGTGSMLGEGLVGNPATFAYGQALPVFRSALTWLQHEARGIVIIDMPTAARKLADAPALVGEDAAHAIQLSRDLAPRVGKDRIYAPRPDRQGAA